MIKSSIRYYTVGSPEYDAYISILHEKFELNHDRTPTSQQILNTISPIKIDDMVAVNPTHRPCHRPEIARVLSIVLVGIRVDGDATYHYWDYSLLLSDGHIMVCGEPNITILPKQP